MRILGFLLALVVGRFEGKGKLFAKTIHAIRLCFFIGAVALLVFSISNQNQELCKKYLIAGVVIGLLSFGYLMLDAWMDLCDTDAALWDMFLVYPTIAICIVSVITNAIKSILHLDGMPSARASSFLVILVGMILASLFAVDLVLLFETWLLRSSEVIVTEGIAFHKIRCGVRNNGKMKELELSPDRFCSKHVLKVDAFLSHGEELRRIEAENYQIDMRHHQIMIYRDHELLYDLDFSSDYLTYTTVYIQSKHH